MYDAWPEKDDLGRIKTANNNGFMFTHPSGASKVFLDEVNTYTGKIVDIGCAYGVATLAALKRSSCEIIALDPEKQHLTILEKALTEDERPRVTLQQGFFPNDFIIPEQSLDAVHCSLVFPFLTGPEIGIGLNKIFQALKPQGKLYLNVLSPYLDFLAPFVPIFNERVAKHEEWPGLITNFLDYFPEENKSIVPKNMYVFTEETLSDNLTAEHFHIEALSYYDPPEYQTTGKGMIQAIVSRT